MKITINWGFWIVVSFILFAAGMFAMVYISMSTSVDLVTDDYYEKELKYQNHIELVMNTNTLEQNVDMVFIPSAMRIHFPAVDSHKKYSGTIHFFRPSDKRGDFVHEVKLDSLCSQSFATALFAQGLWRAKIFWNVGEQQYYSELPFIIQ